MNISTWSKDPSSQVGVVVVGKHRNILTTGYNGLPRGCNDSVIAYPERHARPEKYQWYEHGERNAIYNAAREGVALDGSTMYAPNCACCDCARAVVQAGIARFVFYEDGPFFDRPDWVESLRIGFSIFEEGGVELISLKGFPKDSA